MNQENINKIQNRVIELLNSQGEEPLNVLVADCCSEVARLVGGWVQDIEKYDKFFILKGQNLRNSNRSHDVIAMLKDTKVSVIDPTVWQFFLDKNIFVGNFGSLEAAFIELSKIYGGKWEVSEELNNITETQRKQWKSIIIKNLNKNIFELRQKW